MVNLDDLFGPGETPPGTLSDVVTRMREEHEPECAGADDDSVCFVCFWCDVIERFAHGRGGKRD